jgi:hypothetical protein
MTSIFRVELPEKEIKVKAEDKQNDGGCMFLRNVGCLSTDYTTLYPRRQNSTEHMFLYDRREVAF